MSHPQNFEPQREPTPAWLRATVCFLYFFLIMASYYIMKPVREALFLDTQGFRRVPVVHIMACLVTLLTLLGYEVLARRWRGGRLVILGQPLLAGSIALFWLALRLAPEAWVLPWLYYLGVALYGSFAVAFFWSLTHTLFTPEESRVHYGWIGAGGIAGGSFGGWVTGQTVAAIGSANLLLVAAALVFVCWFLALWLDARRLEQVLEEPARAGPSSWKTVVSEPYVRGIAALVILSLLVAEVGDLQSQRLISDAHLGRDQLSAYWGGIYSRMNLLGLLISLFLAGPVQKRFGPGPGLLLLPFGAVVEAIFMARSPSLEILGLVLVFDAAIQYSIFQSSKELLYNPTGESIKFRAKTLIDTFGYRLGIAIGAIGVLFFLLEAPMWAYSAVAILLSIGTAAVAWWLKGVYAEKVRAAG